MCSQNDAPLICALTVDKLPVAETCRVLGFFKLASMQGAVSR